ncbi:MAG: helix-turn-helix domain-containing protein, partial [Bacteroidota bacterium]
FSGSCCIFLYTNGCDWIPIVFIWRVLVSPVDVIYRFPESELSNLFGKYSDKTPLQVIRERIALEAKRLLRYSDKPISEIGYELGFMEGAHFSRFFKKMSGQSASQFRDQGKIDN